MNTYPKNDKDKIYAKMTKYIHVEKYYKVFNVLYSFQDRNDVILMKINMSLKSQRRELVTGGHKRMEEVWMCLHLLSFR